MSTNRSRWLNWTPRTIGNCAQKEPTKPSIPGSVGFVGLTLAEMREMGAPPDRVVLSPAESDDDLVGIPWAEWTARRLNRLFQEQGVMNERAASRQQRSGMASKRKRAHASERSIGDETNSNDRQTSRPPGPGGIREGNRTESRSTLKQKIRYVCQVGSLLGPSCQAPAIRRLSVSGFFRLEPST